MSNTGEQTIEYEYLSRIKSPCDIKDLTQDELSVLTDEIRKYIIEKVKENGGHLASNLGVVELSLALHRVFDTPKDHIIWDVGHQSYVHKLLTGRMSKFDTLRHGGGLSGFENRRESEHDCFGTGHSSTSLSAALGFAQSDRLNGSDAYTVAVIGDGAFTGGMIHEALNNCDKDLRLIIILNENEMSISKNIGLFSKNFSKIRITPGYLRTKKKTGQFIKRIPLIGKILFKALLAVKIWLKNMLFGANYFEDLGLYYLGPVDGHNLKAVEALLAEAKKMDETVVIHIKTVKGKGFAPAEDNPGKYHGMSPVKRDRVEVIDNYSSVFGKCLSDEAQENEKICAITAAMSTGTGLDVFKSEHPDRFFDVGIAEEHAVTFAAGLAAAGMRPVVAIYSSFLQRAYDSVIHDVALQNLPVVFCLDRAGLNQSDGATHHGIFDVAFMSHIPNMKIYAPASFESLRGILNKALEDNGPIAIRYPNGAENERVIAEFFDENNPTAGQGFVRHNYSDKDSLDALIITHGRICAEALRASDMLKEQGVNTGIILLECLKPYKDIADKVSELMPISAAKIIFLEEEIKAGGMGMILSETLSSYPVMNNKTVRIMALDDNFAIQDKDEPIYKTAKISAEDIVSVAIEK